MRRSSAREDLQEFEYSRPNSREEKDDSGRENPYSRPTIQVVPIEPRLRRRWRNHILESGNKHF